MNKSKLLTNLKSQIISDIKVLSLTIVIITLTILSILHQSIPNNITSHFTILIYRPPSLATLAANARQFLWERSKIA